MPVDLLAKADDIYVCGGDACSIERIPRAQLAEYQLGLLLGFLIILPLFLGSLAVIGLF